jgi:ATP-dependent Clp protease ATP-binding subunit ClpA
MYELYTDRARKVMQLANQSAQLFNHEFVGVEHLFMGLVAEGTGVAAKVLGMFGVTLEKARDEIRKVVQSGPDMVTMGRLPYTPRVKNVIASAIEEVKSLNHRYIDTEHLLLGLLREREGAAYQAMTNMGLNVDEIRSKTLEVIGEDLAQDVPPIIADKHDNHRTVHRIQRLESDLSEAVSMLNDLFHSVGQMLDRDTAKRLTDILDKHDRPKSNI